MAWTSASLLALPVMKLSCFGGAILISSFLSLVGLSRKNRGECGALQLCVLVEFPACGSEISVLF